MSEAPAAKVKIERATILVLERDAAVRDPLAAAVAKAGYIATATGSLEDAVRVLGQGAIPVALVPASGGDAPVAETLRRLREARAEVQAIVHARGASARMVRDAMRAGAADFYDAAAEGPEALDAVLARVGERHATEGLRRSLLGAARPIAEELLRTVVSAERRSLDLEAAARGEPPDGPYRVLIVDHEATARKFLGGLFIAEGLEVHDAVDAAAALAALGGGDIELVVVERRLPGADGLALVHEARGRRGQIEAILVVPAGSPESAASLSEMGLCAMIEKPFDDVAQIAARIRYVVSQHKRMLKAQRYLDAIKERNGDFLARLQSFREKLEKIEGG